mmetsp:Transcript_13194/g.31491  ORF Transcript_13194/g.31491 Transcript_13194/m.31491 type:complete len:236 (+) Transcript_13194:83-790(+)
MGKAVQKCQTEGLRLKPSKNSTSARRPYRPSKPHELKKHLVKHHQPEHVAIRKPRIFKEGQESRGLILGQAPPGPRKTLPRDWRPLAGPAEQRLARLAGLSVQQLWQQFDRANLLSSYPGMKGRSWKHDVSKGYKLHTSDGDVFPIKQAKKAAAKIDLSKYHSVLLLGNSVARAFGVSTALLHVQRMGQTRMMVFPHPSGVSHYWNDKPNVIKAARALKAELRIMRRGWMRPAGA